MSICKNECVRVYVGYRWIGNCVRVGWMWVYTECFILYFPGGYFKS